MKRIFIHIVPIQRTDNDTLFVYAQKNDTDALMFPSKLREPGQSIKKVRNNLIDKLPFQEAAPVSTWLYDTASCEGIHFYYEIYLDRNNQIGNDHPQFEKIEISNIFTSPKLLNSIDLECLLHIPKIISLKAPL